MKRASELSGKLLGDCNDIEVRGPRFGRVGPCTFTEHHEFITHALQKVPCTARRKAEESGAGRVVFKNDHRAVGSKGFGGSPQDQFFSPFDIYFNYVYAADAVLLKEIVERVRLDLFAFVARKRAFAQRIAYGIPPVIKPRFACCLC